MNVHEQMCTPAGVQEVASEWWECEITLEAAEKLSAEYVKQSKDRVKKDKAQGMLITAAGPLVWLKMRLNSSNLLPVSFTRVSDDDPTAVTATLHVGFLTLDETEEMLDRLRVEPRRKELNTPARSKMFATAEKQAVAPIDALAGKVAHTSQQEG